MPVASEFTALETAETRLLMPLAVLIGMLAAYYMLLFIWLRRRDRPVRPAEWDREGSTRFSPRDIGGKPAARLAPHLLDDLAQVIGFYDDQGDLAEVAPDGK